jgi:lysophospholipase L1-like esterase
MYGNGIFYLVDVNTGKPKNFIKGFFHCTTKQSDWHGDFNEDLLADGYTMDMESDFIPFQARRKVIVDQFADKNSCDYLFMGDSWVEQWQDKKRFSFCTYYKDTEGLDAVNVGVGGSKYSDWLNWLDELVFCHNPKKIFINLGFNDLHHLEQLPDVYDNFVKVVTTLKERLPDVRVYINSVTHCSPFVKFFKDEVRLNKMIKEYCDNSDYLVYIDVNKLFTKRGKMIKNMDEFCIDDNLHLNEKGYKIWAPYVMDFVKNK